MPADNPFVGAPGAMSCATAGIGAPTTAKCTEIYDYGLRNPFRFAFDPNTSATRFFINDVGQSTWEEVDEGGSGLNYGWDIREGFCNNGSSTSCPPTPAGYTDPLTVYNHSTGCTYITAGAFIPNGVWAPSYDGGYLFADGGCGKIFLLTSAGTVDYAHPFAQTSGVITDMTFLTQGGADRALLRDELAEPAAPDHGASAAARDPAGRRPTGVASAAVAADPGDEHRRAGARQRGGRPGEARGDRDGHGTTAVTLVSLIDSLYGDLTRAGASSCALGGAIAPGTSYACSFIATISARERRRRRHGDRDGDRAPRGGGHRERHGDGTDHPASVHDRQRPRTARLDRDDDHQGPALHGPTRGDRDAPRVAVDPQALARARLVRRATHALGRSAPHVDAARRANQPGRRCRDDLRRLGSHARCDRAGAGRSLPLELGTVKSGLCSLDLLHAVRSRGRGARRRPSREHRPAACGGCARRRPTASSRCRRPSALARLDRGGPTTASELAKLEQISPQSMGATLAALEARGLVERRPDPDDGRRAVVSRRPRPGSRRCATGATRAPSSSRRRSSTGFTPAELEQLTAAAPLIERLAQNI